MFHESVTDDVAVVELDDADAFDAAQHIDYGHQARIAATRQVDLGIVAGHDEAGVFSHAGKEHLDL